MDEKVRRQSLLTIQNKLLLYRPTVYSYWAVPNIKLYLSMVWFKEQPKEFRNTVIHIRWETTVLARSHQLVQYIDRKNISKF